MPSVMYHCSVEPLMVEGWCTSVGKPTLVSNVTSSLLYSLCNNDFAHTFILDRKMSIAHNSDKLKIYPPAYKSSSEPPITSLRPRPPRSASYVPALRPSFQHVVIQTKDKKTLLVVIQRAMRMCMRQRRLADLVKGKMAERMQYDAEVCCL